MEIWKQIEDYPGYEVSNFGRVRRWHRWPNKDGIITYTLLKPNKLNKKNYYLIRMSKNGEQKAMLLHRLVAKTFLDNPNNFPIVMHLDDDGFNNRVENLKWSTTSENTQSAWDGGLISRKYKTKKSQI